MASSGARLVHLARLSIQDPNVPTHAAYASSTAPTVTRPPLPDRGPDRAPAAAAQRREGSSGARNAPAPCAGPRWCPARRSSAPRCTRNGSRWAHSATHRRPPPPPPPPSAPRPPPLPPPPPSPTPPH